MNFILNNPIRKMVRSQYPFEVFISFKEEFLNHPILALENVHFLFYNAIDYPQAAPFNPTASFAIPRFSNQSAKIHAESLDYYRDIIKINFPNKVFKYGFEIQNFDRDFPGDTQLSNGLYNHSRDLLNIDGNLVGGIFTSNGVLQNINKMDFYFLGFRRNLTRLLLPRPDFFYINDEINYQYLIFLTRILDLNLNIIKNNPRYSREIIDGKRTLKTYIENTRFIQRIINNRFLFHVDQQDIQKINPILFLIRNHCVNEVFYKTMIRYFNLPVLFNLENIFGFTTIGDLSDNNSIIKSSFLQNISSSFLSLKLKNKIKPTVFTIDLKNKIIKNGDANLSNSQNFFITPNIISNMFNLAKLHRCEKVIIIVDKKEDLDIIAKLLV